MSFLHSSPALIYIYTNPFILLPKKPNLITETIRYVAEASAECQSIHAAPEAKVTQSKGKGNTKTICDYYYKRNLFSAKPTTANIQAPYVPTTVLSTFNSFNLHDNPELGIIIILQIRELGSRKRK